MDTLNIKEMMDMQAELFEMYKDEWSPRIPENAHRSLLWSVGEMGEIIEVFQKHGCHEAVKPGPVREHLMEETVDTMMFLWDMLSCMGVTAEEFSDVYRRKHAFNTRRVFGVDKFTTDG